MAKKNAKDLADVVATKGELTRTFPRLTWNLLGPNKQGWEEKKAEPKELTGDQLPAAPAANPAAAPATASKQNATPSPAKKQLTVAQQKKADEQAAAEAEAKAKKLEDALKAAADNLSPEEIAAAKLAEGGTGNE